MDVSKEGQKIPLLLAQYRFITVFEQMPIPAVSPVEVLSIPRQKPAHDGRDALLAALEKDMCVIYHQHPGEDGTFPFPDFTA
jgi:hypothetical protein